VLGGWVVPVGRGVTGANVIDRTDTVTKYRRDVVKGKGGGFGKAYLNRPQFEGTRGRLSAVDCNL
jgi:hypothetical protein